MSRGGVVLTGLLVLPLLGACGLATSGLLAADGANGLTNTDGGPPPLDASLADVAEASAPAVDAAPPAPDGAGDDGPSPAIDANAPDACAPSGDVAAMGTTASIAQAPKIDGDLGDWPCDGRIAITAANSAFVKTGGDPISAELAARWDKDNLYVAIHVTDPSVGGADPTDPYKNDSIEVYVTGDAAPNGDYDAFSHQLVVDWKGLVVDYGPSHDGLPGDTKPAHFKAATKATADGWAFEAMIGGAMITSGPFTVGTSIGFDVEINDGDGTGQVGALVPEMEPAPATCSCKQTQCCCGKTPDLPYCDSARISRTTLK